MRSLDLIYRYLEEKGYNIRFHTFKNNPNRHIIATDSASGHETIVAPYSTGSHISREIAGNKAWTYEVATMNDVHIPETLVVDTSRSSEDVFSDPTLAHLITGGKSLIVKPLDSYQSKGLTLDITTPEQLKEALSRAFEFSSSAIIQRQVSGDELRITCVRGEPVSVLLRQKPAVTGDGIRTLSELIAEENQKREVIEGSAVPYPQLTPELIDTTLDLSSIPALNETTLLSNASMIRTGASIYEIIDLIHPSYLEIARKLAGLLPSSLVSIDIMTENPHEEAIDDSYSLIEINTGMSLLLYYSCRDGKHTDLLEHHLGPLLVADLTARSIYPSNK